jgi:hypothetical protein
VKSDEVRMPKMAGLTGRDLLGPGDVDRDPFHGYHRRNHEHSQEDDRQHDDRDDSANRKVFYE